MTGLLENAPSLVPGGKGRWISGHGVRTMAVQEFRLRLRAGRWRWLLVSWFVLLLLFTVLLRVALRHSGFDESYYGADGALVAGPSRPLGTPMFGGLMLFVLGLALLVAPALTSQSVNGDRDRGVLATLQTTLLTPAEIAVGKLVAAWLTTLVFLACAVPMLVWSMISGGVELGRALISLGIVALLLGVVCAMCQSLSAVFVRSTTSAVMSYLLVFVLSGLTVLAFALAAAGTSTTRTVSCPVMPTDGAPADTTTPPLDESCTYDETTTHTERVWWLLAPNPFVILADGAPRASQHCDPRTHEPTSDPLDPLGSLGNTVRTARLTQRQRDIGVSRTCAGAGDTGYYSSGEDATPADVQTALHPPAVWPWGLAFDVLLGLVSVVVTVRRLRTPSRRLARGTRVA